MKKLNHLLLGVFFIGLVTFSYIQYDVVSVSNLNLKMLIKAAQADGEGDPGACCLNGYKNWNHYEGEADGVDCWCNDRELVKDECSCD